MSRNEQFGSSKDHVLSQVVLPLVIERSHSICVVLKQKYFQLVLSQNWLSDFNKIFGKYLDLASAEVCVRVCAHVCVHVWMGSGL